MYLTIESQAFDTTVYGIEGKGECVPDLSTERADVEGLARLCEEGGLAPWQLHNVAEDWVQGRAIF